MGNPFIFTKPVQPANFIGRESELSFLLNRVHNGESAIVTGQPRIGKSSLLLKLSSTFPELIQRENRKCIPIQMSSGCINPSSSPLDFWNYIADMMAKYSDGSIEPVKLDSLNKVVPYFKSLDESQKVAVLLIDGFGWLLDNKQFDLQFWGMLRHIASSGDGLCYIAFSRLTSQELQLQIEKEQRNMGSPFMNIATQVNLSPFSYDETKKLIEKTSKENESYFTPKDNRIVWQLSGGHPFLVQLVSSLIWNARSNGQSFVKDGYNNLTDEVIEIASPHFWDTWRYLSPIAQTLGLMLSLREIAYLRKYDTTQLDESLQIYQPDIQRLQRAGLLQIENQQPILSSLCFGMWILRNQAGLGKEISQPEDYLQNNLKVFGHLTRKQMDTISRTTEKVYSDLKETVVDIGGALARVRLGLP